MNITTIIASASVAAVLGVAGVSVAGAASNSGSSPSAFPAPTAASAPTPAPGAPVAGIRRHLRRAAGRIVAETIGITRPALRRELLAGKTIATIATEHGVAPQTVVSALESAANTRIDAAQSANKITAETAAKLKSRFATAIPKFVNDWHPKHLRAG